MNKYHELMINTSNICKKNNVDDWVLIISDSVSVSANSFKHEIIKEASSFSSALSIRVIKNGKEGCASTQLLESSEIDSLVERAIDNATLYDKTEKPIIFDEKVSYKEIEKLTELNYNLSDIKKLALKALETLYQKDNRVIDGSTCSAAYGKSIRYFASSKGLELIQSSDDAYLMANCKVSDSSDIQNAYSVKEGLINNADITDSVDKAIKQLNPKKIESGCYNIIFSPDTMNQILDTFFSVFTGKSSAYSLTRYKDKEGERIASEKITIIDDPFYAGYRMQASFDGDGHPCYTKNVIENGVLKTLLYNLEYGSKCGKASTGNGYRSAISGASGIASYSFYIKPSELSLEELCKICNNGIYVTQMKGFHAGANAITGDFSIESAGFRIRDSKVCEPINEFTVSGNFYKLLENVIEVANDLEFDVTLSSERFGTPSVLVKDLAVSGK